MYDFGDRISNENIINNVIFFGGATTFKNNKTRWNQIFKRLISGRIVNCYSEEDYVLKYLYQGSEGKQAIGSHKFKAGNEGEGEIIENIKLDIGHIEYRKCLDEIVKKINL